MRLFEVVNRARARRGLLLTALAALTLPHVAAAQAPEIVLNPSAPSARAGRWTVVTDTSAAGDRAIRHANGNAAKLTTARSSPTDYFEVTFTAAGNTPYRLWIHGKADNNHWGNDSVFVQFDRSVTSSNTATWRIGTTSAAEVNLEDCSGCGLSGWKWQDNGWGRGVLGPVVRFNSSGTQRMRIQTREDGLSIDQIILSPAEHMNSAPTSLETVTQSPTQPAPAPEPDSQPASGSTLLKVFDWNIHHGVGTDGVYNLDRFIPYIVASGANVVSLNEVEKYVGSYGNVDQAARFAALLRSATGRTWYHHFAQRDGNTNGQGNAILSTFPFEDTDEHQLSYSRSVARVQILVNGIRVNIFSTHLDADSSSRRTTQINQLKTWANSFSQQWIFAGDFNAWPGATEIANMTSSNYDAWAQAVAAGTQVSYPGNTAGNTRNSRIDYVFYSKSATRLRLRAAQVYDVRNSSGVAPSDHRPIMATFEVR